jgi:hypothetical protein
MQRHDTPRHDTPRFSAFTRFIYCHNDQEFLQCLQQAYHEFSIGNELDFTSLANAWLMDAKLPDDWRLALLTHTPCVLDDTNFETSMAAELPSQLRYTNFEWHRADCPFIDGVTSFVEHLVARLFTGSPKSSWFTRQHNLALLMAPLLEPESRAGLLQLFQGWFSHNSRKKSTFEQTFDRTLGDAMRQWASQIAQGEGEWAQVTQWLTAANANPALLATILSQPRERPWEDHVSPLSAIRLLLLQIRELLWLGEKSQAIWVDHLLQHMRNFTSISHEYATLLPTYFSPIIKSLIDSDRVWPLCHPHATYTQRVAFKTLFNAFELASYFTDSTATFSNFVAHIGDTQLQHLTVSAHFAEQYPDLALLFEQEKYNRCHILQPRLKDAAALAWYHSLLTDKLAHGDIYFEVVLEHVLAYADPKLQHQLIQTYLCTDAAARVPDGLLASRQDAKSLLCYMESNNARLIEQAVHRLYALAMTSMDEQDNYALDAANLTADGHCSHPSSRRHPDHWPILWLASANYPDIFIEYFRGLPCDDPARWQLLWSSAQAEEQQFTLASEFIAYIESCEPAQSHEFLALIDHLFTETPAPWLHGLQEVGCASLLSLLTHIHRSSPVALRLVPAIVAAYVKDIEFEQLADPLVRIMFNRALCAYPQALASVVSQTDKKHILRLLPLLDDSAIVACAEHLMRIFAGRSPEIRVAAVSLIARMSPDAIVSCKLLQAAAPVPLLTLIAMASSADPAMIALINAELSHPKHTDYSRGISIAALQRAGCAVDGIAHGGVHHLDPSELELLKQAAQTQSVSAEVKALWNAECASLLAPLGEPLALQLLQQLREGVIELPQHAKALLAFIPAAQQHAFALWCLQQWIADKADALRWLLLPLTYYGDKACAQALLKAAKSWQQKKPLKSKSALAWLAHLPQNMGLPLLVELWQNQKTTVFLRNCAEQALAEIAQRRGQVLDELLEQLVPDLAFSAQNWQWDVDAEPYKVLLHADFSLSVLDANQSSSPGLALAVEGENTRKRTRLESQFMQLQTQLKSLRPQMVSLLNDRFLLGYQWTIPRWQRTFQGHPLWARLASLLVWTITDEQGRSCRVLPVAAGKLITLNAESYPLPSTGTVHLTHPLEISPAECEAWAAEFTKLQLMSPISQWSTPVIPLPADSTDSFDLVLPANTLLSQAAYNAVIDSWQLIRSDDGFHGDGVETDVMALDYKRWQIGLVWRCNSPENDMETDYHECCRLALFKREMGEILPYPLKDAPPALVNTLLCKARILAEVAI